MDVNIRLQCVVLACMFATGCAGLSPQPVGDPASGDASREILNVATIIQDQWSELPIKGRTQYRIVSKDGRLAIQAVGRNAASGLIRAVDIDTAECPTLEWMWRVDTLQTTADIRGRSKEDVAASLFLLFGDVGFLAQPEPVPTLRYVWTSATSAREAIITSAYVDSVKSLVVESGEALLGQWVTERRNIVADYQRAFGHPPDDSIQSLAIFTDTDQTKEPVESYYGWIRVNCVD